MKKIYWSSRRRMQQIVPTRTAPKLCWLGWNWEEEWWRRASSFRWRANRLLWLSSSGFNFLFLFPCFHFSKFCHVSFNFLEVVGDVGEEEGKMFFDQFLGYDQWGIGSGCRKGGKGSKFLMDDGIEEFMGCLKAVVPRELSIGWKFQEEL